MCELTRKVKDKYSCETVSRMLSSELVIDPLLNPLTTSAKRCLQQLNTCIEKREGGRGQKGNEGRERSFMVYMVTKSVFHGSNVAFIRAWHPSGARFLPYTIRKLVRGSSSTPDTDCICKHSHFCPFLILFHSY